MPHSPQKRAARTRHVQMTPEAFRELAETALEELYDSTDTFDLHDMRGWCRMLTNRIGEISDHASGGADVAGDGLAGLRLCDASGN